MFVFLTILFLLMVKVDVLFVVVFQFNIYVLIYIKKKNLEVDFVSYF